MKLLFLGFVWGPALLGYGLGWLVVHPDDWTGPAVVVPIGAALTGVTFALGVRKARSLESREATLWWGAMASAATVGVMLFGMLVTGVLS